MQGSLALKGGLLYVGRHEKTARIAVYDLDGHRRSEGFCFRDPRGRSEVAGLAVDDDRQVWVADTPASRVRTFTVFGRETGGWGLALDELVDGLPPGDAPGLIRVPTDVEVEGSIDGGRVVIASGGERRHAVGVFDPTGTLILSLRPRGNPHLRFQGVRGLSLAGRFLYVAEAGAGTVQVFRDGDFHFAFSVPGRAGLTPVAVAGLEDGRMVVACAGDASALLLVDAAGRLLRVLAGEGTETGGVFQPNDVVVEPGREDRTARVGVVDQDGERVQVFTLEGRSYGAFAVGA